MQRFTFSLFVNYRNSFFFLFWLHFKADWNKRVAQFDQAEAVYEKYIDGKNNDPNFKYDIKEEDKLRGAVGDKKALVDRAESEHDQQVQAFNALQTQIYTIDLPALCRKFIQTFLDLSHHNMLHVSPGDDRKTRTFVIRTGFRSAMQWLSYHINVGTTKAYYA